MEPIDADRLPEVAPPADPVSSAVDPAVGPTTLRPRSSARIWSLALVAGLLAGFASWLVGESVYGRFKPPLLNSAGFPTVEEVQAAAQARASALTLEVSLTIGVLGAALGLALGLAGGWTRGSARSAAISGLIGAILGAVAGALMVQILLPIYSRFYHPDRDDLLLAICIQGGLGAALGAAGGASLGIGIGGGRSLVSRSILGGLLGGVLGILVYQIVGVVAFPLDQTTKPLSLSSGARLFSQLAVAVLASLGAAKGALDSLGGGPPQIARRADA